MDDIRDRFIEWSSEMDMKYNRVFSILDIEKKPVEYFIEFKSCKRGMIFLSCQVFQICQRTFHQFIKEIQSHMINIIQEALS